MFYFGHIKRGGCFKKWKNNENAYIYEKSAGGVFMHVVENSSKSWYVAADANTSLIMMWKAFQEGWYPDTTRFDEARFRKLKANGDSSAEKGFFGHAATFSGLYFKDFRPELSDMYDYYAERLVVRSTMMKDVFFISGDYKSVDITNALIFCDPPYERINFYFDECNRRRTFDSDAFWGWCLRTGTKNVVVISENCMFFDKRPLPSGYTSSIINAKPVRTQHGKVTCMSDEKILVLTSLDVNLQCLD